MVQTPAVKIGETINRRRVETSLCLGDLAEGSRVSVFVPCPGEPLERSNRTAAAFAAEIQCFVKSSNDRLARQTIAQGKVPPAEASFAIFEANVESLGGR